MNNKLKSPSDGYGDGYGDGDGYGYYGYGYYGYGYGDGHGDGDGYGDGGDFTDFESDTYLLSLLGTKDKETVELYVALLNSETQEEKDSVLGILELRRDQHANGAQ